jgi:hypothetical protein
MKSPLALRSEETQKFDSENGQTLFLATFSNIGSTSKDRDLISGR